MKRKNDDKKETPFCYRGCEKSELAALYLPDILLQGAMRLFNERIVSFPGSTKRLRITGLRVHAKHRTPAQVVPVTEVLGGP